jgi:hypothetical protein
LTIPGGDVKEFFMWIRCRRVVAAFLLGGLACGAGAHFAALQAVAWAGMVWNYSASAGSLVEGTRQTFSGEHPCAMCTRIKDASQKEPQSPSKALVAAKKIEMIALPGAEDLGPRRRGDFSYPRERDLCVLARFESPPVPVPIVG